MNSRIFAVTCGLAMLVGCASHRPHRPPLSDLINGQVPPMRPTQSVSDTKVLDVVLNGQLIVTMRTVRAAGTRSPIHIHPHGGQTCIISGKMTLYMDSAQPLPAGPGECYWMPPNVRMSGVNTGDTDTVMLDSFVVPLGTAVWQIVEPGQEAVQAQFDNLHKHE